jgi:hypothetical protein
MKAMHVSAAGLYKHMPRAGPHARCLPFHSLVEGLQKPTDATHKGVKRHEPDP